ncbi:MAG: hypothetical protein O3A90_16425 [Proteobacteria bacterium]|nr:hypothetical protein [Pseudomonadota bacterium]MDA0850801.1 hypothetical protein [Pseudomonadota bacterium]MDA1294359.1 hypothetical protein [Pseudomonadota bacterium]
MKARDFLKKHFPDLKGAALQIEIELMIPALICEGSHLEMVVKNKNIKAVEEMRRGFLQFWNGYKELDPLLRKFVKMPPHADLCNMYWMLTGRNPSKDFPKALGMKEEYPNNRGTFDDLIAAIEKDATHIHHHAEQNEYPNKAALIRFARAQWERNQKCSPAMKPSEGTPFYIFLEDLVEYVDREWSIVSLLRAEQAAFLL